MRSGNRGAYLCGRMKLRVRVHTQRKTRCSSGFSGEKEATLNALAVEAFNDLLRKHGKRSIVENPLLDD
jgi:hypothetical protein